MPDMFIRHEMKLHHEPSLHFIYSQILASYMKEINPSQIIESNINPSEGNHHV